MAKPITGKTHVGERREKRPNGDIYAYERITAYNEKTRKSYEPVDLLTFSPTSSLC